MAAVIANANRGRKDRAFSPEDFVLRFERPVERDPEEILQGLIQERR